MTVLFNYTIRFLLLYFVGVVDCDSDSDGISVISETEDSLKESSSDDLSQEFFTTANICRRDDVVESIGSNIGTAEVRIK